MLQFSQHNNQKIKTECTRLVSEKLQLLQNYENKSNINLNNSNLKYCLCRLFFAFFWSDHVHFFVIFRQ